MRGIAAFLLGAIILVISLVIVLTVLGIVSTYNPQKTATNAPPQTNLNDNFDYRTYLLDKNPVDMNTYTSSVEFCQNLKTAIKYAILTGRPYEVDEIAYGSDLVSRIPFPFIGNCPDEKIDTEVAKGLNQTVCQFTRKNLYSNQYDLNGLSFPYFGITDGTELDFDNCTYYPYVPYSNIFWTAFIGPIESLDHSPDTVYLYYSPDYLYMRQGDYSHYPFYNPLAFDNAYNGPGRLKIYVGNATVKDGECTFNIYFCPRPAIAKTKENSTISIFNLFRNLEIYDLSFYNYYTPYYMRDFSQDTNYKDMSGYTKKVYYWNYYDINLDGKYRVETIINAIKAGLYLNTGGKGLHFDHPHWDISRNSTINKGGECWNSEYDKDLIKPPYPAVRTRSIRFNCGDDNYCSGELRIKIAIRNDFKKEDINGDGEVEDLSYISGVISFCDDSAIPVCGNNEREGLEQCDGTDLDGYTSCAGLDNFASGPLDCVPKGQPYECMFNTSLCVPAVCGNKIKEGNEKCDCGATADCTDEGGGDLGTPPANCTSLGYTGGGTLKCKDPTQSDNCTFDTSDCIPYMNYFVTNLAKFSGDGSCGEIKTTNVESVDIDCVADGKGNRYCLQAGQSSDKVGFWHPFDHCDDGVPYNAFIFQTYGDSEVGPLECSYDTRYSQYYHSIYAIDNGLVNASPAQPYWSLDDYLKKFRQAWCGSENINCLLCYTMGGASSFYVCRGKPPVQSVGGYIITYPVAPDEIIDSKWKCKSDGNWEMIA